MLNYNQIPFVKLKKNLTASYGDYLHPLGAGASGSVSLFRRFEDRQLVAIKHFNPPPGQSQIERKEYERQIKLEYHVGALLNGLDGISQSIDLIYVAPSATWHLVTEYSPRNLAAERGRLSKSDTLEIFYQTLNATRSIHQRSLVYGDAKVENILLTHQGDVKLIDFGSATLAKCRVESPRDDVNVVPGDFGTPAYMPPEVFNVLEYDRQKADVWAMGILLHAMFLGHPPWDIASVSDGRFRYFMGWETKGAGERRCLVPYSKIEYATSSVGRVELLGQFPRSVRALAWHLLEPDPARRSSLDALFVATA
ncbi:hypothetical protein GJ744_001993 [Endocarpon pusillum]|uniref:Protein kinase domain-containing protein n=1 Tax=Endocarpon pusillum TaxID=364733 RepID=A0A8H7DZ43_9EURO|nr:hypothetical protein GJ744_001993 [Endocarpon pusillum]